VPASSTNGELASINVIAGKSMMGKTKIFPEPKMARISEERDSDLNKRSSSSILILKS
jgi:hypothetical protein